MFRINGQDGSSRRDFMATCLHALAGVTIVGVVSPILSACGGTTPTSVDTSFQQSYSVATLTGDGKALMTTTKGADGFPIIIVRQNSTTYVALSARCTHENCQVQAPQGSTITCTCHGSRFDLQGNVLQGPANTPLYKYSVTYDASAQSVTVKAV